LNFFRYKKAVKWFVT